MEPKRDKSLKEYVAVKLKEIRISKGIKHEDIAFDLKLTISRYENGTRDPQISTLCKICDYYGITLTEFFKDFE